MNTSKTFSEDVQSLLERMRQTIHRAAPEAEEAISSQIPTFKLNGNLVHFAAFKNHIGSIQQPQTSEHSKKNYPFTKDQKARYNFP